LQDDPPEPSVFVDLYVGPLQAEQFPDSTPG
jgi:hypothetical protein